MVGYSIHLNVEDIMAHLDIFTDGGFSRKQGNVGSWAFVIIHNDKIIHQDSGTVQNTTSQQMEMNAIRKALKYVAEQTFPNFHNVTITLTSDSQYCVKGLTEWWPDWKRRGWRTSGGEPVKNLNIWKALLPLAHETFKSVEFKWVRGHNGNYYNEIADRLCNEALGRKV